MDWAQELRVSEEDRESCGSGFPGEGGNAEVDEQESGLVPNKQTSLSKNSPYVVVFN